MNIDAHLQKLLTKVFCHVFYGPQCIYFQTIRVEWYNGTFVSGGLAYVLRRFIPTGLLSGWLLCGGIMSQTWSQGYKFQGQGQRGQGQGQGLDLQGQGQGLGLQGQGLDRQGRLGPSPTYKVKAKEGFTVHYITLIIAALSKSLDDDASMCRK